MTHISGSFATLGLTIDPPKNTPLGGIPGPQARAIENDVEIRERQIAWLRSHDTEFRALARDARTDAFEDVSLEAMFDELPSRNWIERRAERL